MSRVPRSKAALCTECHYTVRKYEGHDGPHITENVLCELCYALGKRLKGHTGEHAKAEDFLTCGHRADDFVGLPNHWGRCKRCKGVSTVKRTGRMARATDTERMEAMLIDLDKPETWPEGLPAAPGSVAKRNGNGAVPAPQPPPTPVPPPEAPLSVGEKLDRSPHGRTHERPCSCCQSRQGEPCAPSTLHATRSGTRGVCGCCLACQMRWAVRA